MGEAPVRDDGAVTVSAEYVGSFPVDDRCLDDQMKLLHTQLKSLRACDRRRPVSLKFSVKGVKMYDEDETTLLMAHALRRVSLSTARPVDAQFAFISHNPGRADGQLYCHLYRARHSRAASSVNRRPSRRRSAARAAPPPLFKTGSRAFFFLRTLPPHHPPPPPLQAQFLNLLLCRCFQLRYLEKHPEEAREDSGGPLPRRNPSLLNHGFPLSVSALVSFRRAPFQGLLPGTTENHKSSDELPSESFPTSSPSLVRKKAMRTKGLRSGAYRSFTFTPLRQRSVQWHLRGSPGGHKEDAPVRRTRAPRLAETEEALAQAVWCCAGIATESCCSLLADDVLGSYLLCPHPKKTQCGSLIIRMPSGLLTLHIENTSEGKFLLETHSTEFGSLAELIEHYTETRGELACLLSCARVNHCYEWEEHASRPPEKAQLKSAQRKEWI